ncbi:MAG: HPF/RaiA family ribosome-associated protein [Bacteroidales bacterium]|nr:HPF/RaiA family ribosome-associated protein [Bacteroidales bacterium]
MEITIQSVNFETSVSLNEFINKKIEKLNRFAEIRTAEVQLKIINTSDKANKEIGMKVFVGDQEFFASKNAEAYEDAVSQACEAIERQMKKAKEKNKA